MAIYSFSPRIWACVFIVLFKLAVELTCVFAYGDNALSCHCPPLAPKRREVIFSCFCACFSAQEKPNECNCRTLALHSVNGSQEKLLPKQGSVGNLDVQHLLF